MAATPWFPLLSDRAKVFGESLRAEATIRTFFSTRSPAAPLGRRLGSPALRYCQYLSQQASGANTRHPAFAAASPARPKRAAALSPVQRDAATARLEAVLFISREPISSRRLAQLTSLADGTEARTLVRRLNRLYDQGGSAFRVEEVAGGFQMLSRAQFGPWLRRSFRSPVGVHLSAPAMETLAVVAYRQPVLRVDVESIRGVQCGEILRQLMDRDLVKIQGRAEELGRPFLYATTKRFLQVFGLRHLDELPRASLLRGSDPARMATKSKSHATHPGDDGQA